MLFLHNTCRAYFECSAVLSKPRFSPCCSHPEMSHKRIGRRAVVVMNAILPPPRPPQLVGISQMVCAVLFKMSFAFLFFYFLAVVVVNAFLALLVGISQTVPAVLFEMGLIFFSFLL